MDFGEILNEWENKNRKTDDDSVAINDKKNENGSLHPGEYRKKLLKMKPEAEIDLHGSSKEEAEVVVTQFIDTSLRRGLKKVRIIHGKGNHSEEGPVLANAVRGVLERHPGCGEFGYAKGSSGGKGAVWVLLRYRSR